MVFSSVVFICAFLPLVFLLNTLIPSVRGKNALLIVASLVFYAYGEPVYIVLMLISTVANWIFGLLIGSRVRSKLPDGTPMRGKHAHSAQRSRTGARVLLALAVVLNLGFLGIFKYTSMVVQTLDSALGLGFVDPGIALPIGISFYTFQAMSYVIDVYRGEVTAQRSYAKVLLYIAFFPQLVAGPIVKYHDIEAQLTERQVTLSGVASGLRRFCIGLGKKVLIANTMAVTVDSIYAAQLDHINIAVAWIAALAYLMQIYFDFSGYSDMAIGMARMFGFHYKENFAYPYSSMSIKTFWRRWHISLSTWFRQYLYFPLGGNRKGRPRTVLNKLIVFLLCGLWHGASWTFVVWGLIHGLFLLLEEYVPIRRLPKPVAWLYCIVVVTVAFVLFRAESFEQGGYFIVQMFTGFHFEYVCTELAMRQLTPLFVGAFVVALIASQPIKEVLQSWLTARSSRLISICEIASYVFAFVLLVFSLISVSGGGYNPFIYFRF